MSGRIKIVNDRVLLGGEELTETDARDLIAELEVTLSLLEQWRYDKWRREVRERYGPKEVTDGA
jgi:hypothetical protein